MNAIKKAEQNALTSFLKESTGLDFQGEYAFFPGRKWRFDFACIHDIGGCTLKIAIELDGVSFNAKSRHRTGTGFLGDMEKYNAAVTDGWAVLRYTPYEIHGYEWLWVYNAAAGDIKRICETGAL